MHRALWNRPHLRPKLFCSTTLTFPQYLDLENCLNKNNPSRENNNYVIQDAHQIKRDCLLETSPITEPIDDPRKDTEDENDDHEEIKPYFPVTIRYCDISPLRLTNLPVRCRFPIFFREEYEVLSRLLNSDAERKKHHELESSSVISGQPGIGKTTYLYLLLVERLLDGKRTYYQDEKGAVFLINDSITPVTASTLIFENGHVVALVDADKKVSEPDDVLCTSRRIQVVATSSPKTKKDRSWLKQLGDGMGSTYAMALWSKQEFIVASMFFYPWDIPYKRVKFAIAHFGLNPRISFEASKSDGDMAKRIQSVMTEITLIPRDRSLDDLYLGTFTNMGISHLIFELDSREDNRNFDGSRVKAVSGWVLDLVLKRYEIYRADAAYEFYDFTKRTPTAAPLTGIIWERQVHIFFCSIQKAVSYTLRSLNKGLTSALQIPENVESAEFQLHSLGTLLEAKKMKQVSCYFTPVVINFGAIDSLFYQPAELVCLQITSASTHSIQASGLRNLRRCLKPNGPLQYLRPSTEKPWRFIFVVPKRPGASFGLQNLEGESTDIWKKKIQQYVLELSDEEVWFRN